MTTAQKTGLRWAAAILLPSAGILLTAGMQVHKLDGKEDRADHAADIRTVQESVRDEHTLRELQHVRDSATMSVVLERVTDLSCQQNPSRSYCR